VAQAAEVGGDKHQVWEALAAEAKGDAKKMRLAKKYYKKWMRKVKGKGTGKGKQRAKSHVNVP